MEKIFRILFLAFTLFFLSLFFSSSVHAESIQNFKSEITVNKNGSFDVLENIVYDFETAQRHGILRTIPLTRKVGELYNNIEILVNRIERNNQSENYTVSYAGSEISIKIGNADVLLRGVNTYTILYTVKNEIGNYEDHDELYWNVTGNEWNVPIYSAGAIINSVIPITNAKCFTGSFSSQDENCTYSKNNQSESFTANSLLSANQGLSIVVGFPANSFPKSILTGYSVSQKPIPGYVIFIFIFLVGLYYILLPLAVLFWYLKHKRNNRFGEVTVNFDIPKDKNNQRILPAEAGTIDTSVLDRGDIVATLVDLAIRKYVKIEEVKDKKSFLGIDLSSRDILIVKLKDYSKDNLNKYEETLLSRLFKKGKAVKLKDISGDFYETFAKIDEQVFDLLVNRKFYVKNPKNQRAVLLFLGIFALVSLNIFLGILFFVFIKVLNGRTALGDEMDWKIDGLKLFLKSMKREYKWEAEQLAIVEKMIPYAIALGYIDKFLEELKIIMPNYQPDWYSGSMFYASSFSLFNSMNASFATTVSRSSNWHSSSSGFSSSGGFSGGGGGGGGGGSW